MLVLHDKDCLLHETVEYLGAKTIPALESPARLQAILAALEQSPHKVQDNDYSSLTETEKSALFASISENHDAGYLAHLQSHFSDWRAADLVADDGTVLPECFRFPTSISNYKVNPQPPKDIFARHGYYCKFLFPYLLTGVRD
jgi:acetoin utilization deacetylase AcuC-like enzyme